jgi:hypothetical protein
VQARRHGIKVGTIGRQTLRGREREREREGERKKCVDDSSVSKVVEFLRDAIRSFAAPLRYAFRREDSPPRLAATRNNNSAAAAF